MSSKVEFKRTQTKQLLYPRFTPTRGSGNNGMFICTSCKKETMLDRILQFEMFLLLNGERQIRRSRKAYFEAVRPHHTVKLTGLQLNPSYPFLRSCELGLQEIKCMCDVDVTSVDDPNF